MVVSMWVGIGDKSAHKSDSSAVRRPHSVGIVPLRLLFPRSLRN